ncbi:conjugal transfer protein TrbC (plasmid) [Burkholderia sp. MBR-1]|nr:conjugal transfer protein TrbC [Burkholderia sp. MBR-1]
MQLPPLTTGDPRELDPALANALDRQGQRLAAGQGGTLADVPALRSSVPAHVLTEAQQVLAPGKRYIQNLTAGEGNPDGAGMAKVTTVVFISTSMPQSSLEALFAQASGRSDVAFVVRGWTPPNFRELVGKIMAQMPKNKPQANVLVYPQAFEQYGIDVVPVTLHRRSADGKWFKLTGEISVDGAIAEIERGRAGKVVGNTYKIAEPDILSVIRTRMAAIDWNKQIANARASARQRPFDGIEMPRASRTDSHLFDPSIVLSRDVVNPANGQLLARKGTAINPLDLQPFPYVVLAFDPYDAWQMQWAIAQVKAHPSALVFVTRNAMHGDGNPTWGVLKTRTFPLDERAATRFDIKAVPTLVRQEGRSMLITTFAPGAAPRGE